LDLYFASNENLPSRDDDRVRELSRLLHELPYHGSSARKQSFRNPAGVAFKLQNLHNVATGKGLANVSHMDRKVWSDFGSQRDKVKDLAELIRCGVKVAESLQDDFDSEEFVEGRVITELHKRRERAPNVRKQLLASKRKTAKLVCEMCDVGPRSADPRFEDAAFEAHHLLPIGMALERKTRLADMALLCATCHRYLHRAISISQRWLTISEARKFFG